MTQQHRATYHDVCVLHDGRPHVRTTVLIETVDGEPLSVMAPVLVPIGDAVRWRAEQAFGPADPDDLGWLP